LTRSFGPPLDFLHSIDDNILMTNTNTNTGHCTTLCHVYPIPASGALISKGTPCYCGKAVWGTDKRHKSAGVTAKPTETKPTATTKPATVKPTVTAKPIVETGGLVFGRFKPDSIGGKIAALLSDGLPHTAEDIAAAVSVKSVKNITASGGWYSVLKIHGEKTKLYTLVKTDDDKLILTMAATGNN
jgi:hypothetical protein